MEDTTATPVTNQAATDPNATVQAFDVNAYNATLETVRRRMTIIEKSKEELKKLKEMYDSALMNNAVYVEADKAVKDATNKRKLVTNQLIKQPGMADTIGKMKTIKEQVKENEESLADELMEYYRTAGVTEIEDENGQVQEFVISIRLKPKVNTG